MLSDDKDNFMLVSLLYYPKGLSSYPGSIKNFHFFISSRPALGPPQPPVQRVFIKRRLETLYNLMIYRRSVEASIRFVKTKIAE
jgi:hypothetical protein